MNALPNSDNLRIEKLTAIFGNTTNSYKYIWFLAILESLNKEIISMNHLAIKMIAKVWFPINAYHLSFGKQDSFVIHIKALIAQNHILTDYKSQALEKWLGENLEDKNVHKIIKELLQYVPFRFLTPFFAEKLTGIVDAEKNKLIVEYANLDFLNHENYPIYKFSTDKKHIILHPLWHKYLQKHQVILTDFCKWNLLRYLQKNNPNVPNIADKLEPETQRDLKNGKTFWKNILTQKTDFQCIYSNKNLSQEKISIDHFLPWSFVGHDLLWNLLPTIPNVNSAKSDKLPNIKSYLAPFLNMQYEAFQLNFGLGKTKLLEDYSLLFSKELTEIQQLSQTDFCNILKDNILPMHQIAKNMGFTPDWTYKP